MPLSNNNFSQSRPTKSTNSFANNKPTKSTNTFADNKPTANKDLFEGENITGTAFGGDDANFSDQFGQNSFGGFAHFKNRVQNTPSHT